MEGDIAYMRAVKANSSADPRARLDDEELIAEMYSLTLAGHETTSSTLAFLFYELAKNPQYQERMRQEIREARARVISRGGDGFKTEDLDSLTLSTNAIKASGPLKPPLLMLLTAARVARTRRRCGFTLSSSASLVSR